MTARSDRIKHLVEDPDLKQAFQDVRDALYRVFCETPPSDTETLIETRKHIHLLDSVEANLYQAIQDGQLEDFRANEGPAFLGDIAKWRKRTK